MGLRSAEELGARLNENRAAMRPPKDFAGFD